MEQLVNRLAGFLAGWLIGLLALPRVIPLRLSLFYRRSSKSGIEREVSRTVLRNSRCPGRPDHVTSLAIGAITAETSENTTFLMAQGLEHRKTRDLEVSSMAVGGGGAALVACW